MRLLKWDIYDVKSSKDLNGVKFRGRLRKWAIEQQIDLLCENTEDRENGVRFAVLIGTLPSEVFVFICENIAEDADIELVMSGVVNPVLSKLACNDVARY